MENGDIAADVTEVPAPDDGGYQPPQQLNGDDLSESYDPPVQTPTKQIDLSDFQYADRSSPTIPLGDDMSSPVSDSASLEHEATGVADVPAAVLVNGDVHHVETAPDAGDEDHVEAVDQGSAAFTEATTPLMREEDGSNEFVAVKCSLFGPTEPTPVSVPDVVEEPEPEVVANEPPSISSVQSRPMTFPSSLVADEVPDVDQRQYDKLSPVGANAGLSPRSPDPVSPARTPEDVGVAVRADASPSDADDRRARGYPSLSPLRIVTDEQDMVAPTERNRLTPVDAGSAGSPADARSSSQSPQPVNRIQVEKVAAPEIAKNVRRMFETGELADRHEVRRTPMPNEEPLPAESGVFENEPAPVSDDVIRGGDYVADEVQRGLTKSLLSQWQTKGSEEFQVQRRPIVVAEAEGRVVENEPVRRTDVVRADDADPTVGLPSRGQAQLLRQQWTTLGADQQTAPKDARALFLAEVAAAEAAERSSVLENEPERRSDVLREDDNVEEVWLRKGYTRDLAGFWSSPRDAGAESPRQPIQLPRGEPDQPAELENEPAPPPEGVVRSSATYTVDEGIAAVEKGRAKAMVGMWQNKKDEPKAREPFRLDVEVNEAGGGVYENAPVARDGVVRSTDQVDEVMGQRGLIRNISERFKRDPTEEEQRLRKGPPRDMIVIDRAEGPSVLENEPSPVRADVVRSEGYQSDLTTVERGTTRNLLATWRNKEIESNSPQMSPNKPAKLDLAPEAGVYENEPEQVRADVVRSDEYEPDVIPVARTRSTRAMWSRLESDDNAADSKKTPPSLVRFTPPREVTPPRAVQEDFRSFQTLTLSPSKSATPGNASPNMHSPGAGSLSPQPMQEQRASPADKTLTSSTTLVLKSH